MKGSDTVCGITGIVSFIKQINYEPNIIEQMTTSLKRRGPDDTNYWSNKHINFGHTRLAIIDINRGKQPMVEISKDCQYVLAYNGELYNTDSLRTILKTKNYQFSSHSDTEVLLYAYIEWQEKCLEYLNGIFAFAIWDENRNHVFIGRDRLGVKPLFYAHIKDELIFGSEIKALLKHPRVTKNLSTAKLSELLSLGPSRVPGSGIFDDINELLPGHFLIFSANGLKIKKYWDVQSKPHRDTYEETVEKVKILLTAAIKRQLVSDVGICTLLSGGIDSSAITAISAKHLQEKANKQLDTYSVEYENNEHYFKKGIFQPNRDDHYINLVQKHYNTAHKEIILNHEHLVNALEAATYARDFPGMADVDSSLLLFAEEIRPNYKVALSGECADEIFGGYPWFSKDENEEVDTFPWIRSEAERELLLNDFWQNKLNISATLQANYQKTIAQAPILEGESAFLTKKRQLFYLCMKWFMATLLERKDRMSMYASVEVRVPFADHHLVDYAWNIPLHMKIINGREKAVLRDAVAHLLPSEIIKRKKSPYPKTHNPLYRKLVTEKLKTILKSDSIIKELFAAEKINMLIDQEDDLFKTPWFGQLMTGPQLLAYLLQIHYWFEHVRPTIH